MLREAKMKERNMSCDTKWNMRNRNKTGTVETDCLALMDQEALSSVRE